MYTDETYIFPADKEGDVSSWSEVWGTKPSNHEGVLNDILNGRLTEDDFDD